MAKALLIGALFYGISPIDLIPDVLPVIGQMDDLAVLIIAVMIFLRMTTSIRQDLRRNDIIDIERSKRNN